MPKDKRPGTRGTRSAPPVQRMGPAPGKRTLTSRLPAPVQAAETNGDGRVPDRTKFEGALQKNSSSSGTQQISYDLDGDGRPNFTIRCQSSSSHILRTHDFTVDDGIKTDRLDFHFIQDDAWRHGYSGNQSPRRDEDDLLDALTSAIDIAIGAVPIVGEIVDLAEAAAGYTKWGEKMTAGERVVTALAILIPIAGGAVLRKVLRSGATLADEAARMGRAEEEVLAALKAVDARSGDGAAIEAMEASIRAGRKLSKHDLEQISRILRDIDSQERVYRAEAKAGRRRPSELEPGSNRSAELARETEAAGSTTGGNEVARHPIGQKPTLPPRLASKGKKLTHTPRTQALHELMVEAKRSNVHIQSDDEAEKLLDWAASTEGASPESYHAITMGDLIFVRKEHAENVRVLREELIHVFQQRAGMATHEVVQKEIEARLMMIRYRHRWGITNDEVREMIAEVRAMRRSGRY